MIPTNIGEAKLVLPEVTLGDEITLPKVGARPQELEARPRHGGIGLRKRHLLADDRRHVAVGGQQKRLQLSAHRITCGRERYAVRVAWEHRREWQKAQEAEHS